MIKHFISLTIDCDPDGLSGKEVNRNTLSWKGLDNAAYLPEELKDRFSYAIPLTWFLRIDGQIRDVFGKSLDLHEKYFDFWGKVQKLGHEIGWHPHLYKQDEGNGWKLLTDSKEISDELSELWTDITQANLHLKVFRNGEGWINTKIMEQICQSGIQCDSTALPDIFRTDGHPLNWRGTPNQPYYPCPDDVRKPCHSANIVEFPMNTWFVKAPYDKQARLRYMNPAIHPHLFQEALIRWSGQFSPSNDSRVYFWVLIFHPDEILERDSADYLYAYSRSALYDNITAVTNVITAMNHSVEYITLSEAVEMWQTDKRL